MLSEYTPAAEAGASRSGSGVGSGTAIRPFREIRPEGGEANMRWWIDG